MDFLLEIIMTPAVLACIKIAVIILLFAMPLGTVLTLMERKWSAMIQDRVGPNRANIGKFTGHGLLHLAADGLKSIFKEDTIPKGANGFLYFIAPFFGLIAAVATFIFCSCSSFCVITLMRLLYTSGGGLTGNECKFLAVNQGLVPGWLC